MTFLELAKMIECRETDVVPYFYECDRDRLYYLIVVCVMCEKDISPFAKMLWVALSLKSVSHNDRSL